MRFFTLFRHVTALQAANWRQQWQQQMLQQQLVVGSACRAYQAQAERRDEQDNLQNDEHEANLAITDASAAASSFARHQAVWSPARSLPTPEQYSVRVVIRAHDLDVIKAASTAIRDLLLVTFSPKSRAVLPKDSAQGGKVPHVQLVMHGIGDSAPPLKRTHFTVIRGPHVDKHSREQFARTTHTRYVYGATNNLDELTWLLDALKFYEFYGTQVTVHVSSSSHLLPTQQEARDAAMRPLLEAHTARFAHLFGGAAAAPGPAAGSDSAAAGSGSGTVALDSTALQASLRTVADNLRDGLLQQRLKLQGAQGYTRWRDSNAGVAAAAASAGAAAAEPVESAAALLRDAVADAVRSSGLAVPQQADASAAAPGAESGAPLSSPAALAAAVDQVLLSVKLSALDRQRLLPFLMALYQPGSQHSLAPPAEWMQAVLRFGRAAAAAAAAGGSPHSSASAAAQSEAIYAGHSSAARRALLQLLQAWHSAADGAARREFVLPDAADTQEMLMAAATTAAHGAKKQASEEQSEWPQQQQLEQEREPHRRQLQQAQRRRDGK